MRVSRWSQPIVDLEVLNQCRWTAFFFHLQIARRTSLLPFPERWLLKRIFIVSWNFFPCLILHRLFLFVIQAISPIESFQVICWILTILSQRSKDTNLVNHLCWYKLRYCVDEGFGCWLVFCSGRGNGGEFSWQRTWWLVLEVWIEVTQPVTDGSETETMTVSWCLQGRVDPNLHPLKNYLACSGVTRAKDDPDMKLIYIIWLQLFWGD